MSIENKQLVNGLIPKGTPCPFWKICNLCWETCPTPKKLNSVDFSCGMARAFEFHTEAQLDDIPVCNENL